MTQGRPIRDKWLNSVAPAIHVLLLNGWQVKADRLALGSYLARGTRDKWWIDLHVPPEGDPRLLLGRKERHVEVVAGIDRLTALAVMTNSELKKYWTERKEVSA